jgi:hypothetical protein
MLEIKQQKEVISMSFDITIEEPIEASVYELTIAAAETIQGKYSPGLKLTIKLEDGRSFNDFFQLPAKVNNKTGQLIIKLFGELKGINSVELIGRKFKALVESVQRDGRTYVNVSKIL